MEYLLKFRNNCHRYRKDDDEDDKTKGKVTQRNIINITE